MKLNRSSMNMPANRPVKIIQFGEGNFLRAFVDWMVQEMNEKADFNGNVIVVQPIEKGMIDRLNEQDGLYTLILKGIKDKKSVKDIHLIDSISRGVNPYGEFDEFLKLAENPDARFVVSNTTEAGIAYHAEDNRDMQPPSSFPAKVVLLLYHRYKTFQGNKEKGFVFLPCELIEQNGDKLKEYVLKYAAQWQMEPSFIDWIQEANQFCNTLVDRIVPGYRPDNIDEIRNSKGYEDNLVVEGEQYHLWVIKGQKELEQELPFSKAGLNVRIVEDVQPYRTRKVRLLNGPHTVMTPIAYLCGEEYVRNTMQHPVLGDFVRNVMREEILPTIDLPRDEMERYLDRILDRFLNPFVDHALLSISLNSISKFRARVLPIILDYDLKNGELPDGLVLALAAIFAFYRGKTSSGKTIPLQDDEMVLEFFKHQWLLYEKEELSVEDLVGRALENKEFWGRNLNDISGLKEKTTKYLSEILSQGMLNVVQSVVNRKLHATVA
ncbi:tagaturonate reductase [Thermophagus sp. OGC60D27]|uniref:tagaturonate reductase n=1 Tax=Thermophagus sp. OGC60D27 TaxID=3458415 RepID=UPI0040379519